MARNENPVERLTRLRKERAKVLEDFKAKKIAAIEAVRECDRLDKEIKEEERTAKKHAK